MPLQERAVRATDFRPLKGVGWEWYSNLRITTHPIPAFPLKGKENST